MKVNGQCANLESGHDINPFQMVTIHGAEKLSLTKSSEKIQTIQSAEA